MQELGCLLHAFYADGELKMIEPRFPENTRQREARRRPRGGCRFAAFWFCGALNAAALVLGVGAARGQEPDKKYAKEYHHAFKGEPQRPEDLRIVGPGKEQSVKFEPEGLRITLPAGFAGNRPRTGVITDFGINGDFEITVAYEILQESEPVDAGGPARFTLAVALDKPGPQPYEATFSRRVMSKEGRQYFAWLSLGPAETGTRDGRTAPTKAKSGRLRLLREGADLSYLVAEGDDEAFKPLAKFALGPEDVKEVRIVASTGGAKAALDVRVLDLRIRAAALPRPAPKVVEELVVPRAEYPREYYHSFKGNPAQAAGWDFHGPAAAECVQFEGAGLRITLPAGWAGERPSTGLETEFVVKGDFEITMNFAAEIGKGSTRLSLVIIKDTPHKATSHCEVATLSHVFSPGAGNSFGAWMRRRNPDDNDDDIETKLYPTGAKTGRLRLVRSGSELFYLKAEGTDETFKVLGKVSFGAEDLWRVEIVGATGGENAMLDVRIADIRIRAQALPNRSTPGSAGAPATAAADGLDKSTGRGWLMAALLTGAAIVVFSGLAAAAAFVLRQRRSAAQTPAANQTATTEAAEASVAVACAGCGKKLKAKAEWAGRKVKCPQCGKAVAIPAAKASEAE